MSGLLTINIHALEPYTFTVTINRVATLPLHFGKVLAFL